VTVWGRQNEKKSQRETVSKVSPFAARRHALEALSRPRAICARSLDRSIRKFDETGVFGRLDRVQNTGPANVQPGANARTHSKLAANRNPSRRLRGRRGDSVCSESSRGSRRPVVPLTFCGVCPSRSATATALPPKAGPAQTLPPAGRQMPRLDSRTFTRASDLCRPRLDQDVPGRVIGRDGPFPLWDAAAAEATPTAVELDPRGFQPGLRRRPAKGSGHWPNRRPRRSPPVSLQAAKRWPPSTTASASIAKRFPIIRGRPIGTC